MRFLCVTQITQANIFGQEYSLEPLNPETENIKDILVTDDFSARELMERHREVLRDVSFQTERLRRFPQIVNRVCDMSAGRKMLIMRNGGIGDHVTLLPALKVFRDLFPPGIEVTLCCQKEKHPIFYDNPNVDHLVSLPIPLDQVLGYDYLLDFSGRSDWYDLNRMHMTDSYLNFLGIDYERIGCKAPRLCWDRCAGNGICTSISSAKKMAPGRPFILVNWLASNRLREMPPEKLLFLSREIDDVVFVVAQPKALEENTARILKDYPKNILNLTTHMGRLEDLISVIACCDAVVTTDTGVSHLAEGVGKPHMVFYGPTRDHLWNRYYEKVFPVRAEYKGSTCRSPCGLVKETIHGCREAVRLGSEFSPCLRAIPEARVVGDFNKFRRRMLSDQGIAHATS